MLQTNMAITSYDGIVTENQRFITVRHIRLNVW